MSTGDAQVPTKASKRNAAPARLMEGHPAPAVPGVTPGVPALRPDGAKETAYQSYAVVLPIGILPVFVTVVPTVDTSMDCAVAQVVFAFVNSSRHSQPSAAKPVLRLRS